MASLQSPAPPASTENGLVPKQPNITESSVLTGEIPHVCTGSQEEGHRAVDLFLPEILKKKNVLDCSCF